jgi:hypothetical protein
VVGCGGPWLPQPWPAQPGSGGSPRAGDGLIAHGVGARGGAVTVASAPHGDMVIVGGEVG